MLENVFAKLPVTDSTWIFLFVLLIILFAPMVLRPLKIPHILGMILAGVIIGPFGFNVLARDKSFELFGQVGLYYIMFLAALEMDTRSLFKDVKRYLFFGLMTFAIPFVFTFFCSRWFLDYSETQALLLGCILSSNTLIAYPIIGRYGLAKRKSVSYSVGGTMISLLLALIIVAAVSNSWSLDTEENTADQILRTVVFWAMFCLKIALFFGGVFLIIPRITRGFLRHFSDPVSQFIFVMSVLFLTAATAEVLGIEGILGAFLAGLIMNRYIPKLSSLMNRIEFMGNAIFIPYFLIGVGMLINIHSLFTSMNTVNIALFLIVMGLLTKAAAAYLSSWGLKMPIVSGRMMFGLTSAHAAGAIAIIMVGMKLEIGQDIYLMNDDILNGILVMILVTCIVSSIVTESAARESVLRGKDERSEAAAEVEADDEKILIPVKDELKAKSLITLAVLMRNEKLNRGLIALNVVYDDANSVRNQKIGRELLHRLAADAAAIDVRIQTQSRLASNLANGITHAFKEYDASEIIAGTHFDDDKSSSYGLVDEHLINQINRQIILTNVKQPFNTLRKIHVVVPNNAEYEPGFFRWVERMLRVADNLSCRMAFYGKQSANSMISDYLAQYHKDVIASYEVIGNFDEMNKFLNRIAPDHLLVIVAARKGTLSYNYQFDKLPGLLTGRLSKFNQLVIFPDQYGRVQDEMTFINPQQEL